MVKLEYFLRKAILEMIKKNNIKIADNDDPIEWFKRHLTPSSPVRK